MVVSLLVILNKRKSQKIYKPVDVHFLTNIVGKITSLASMWNIVNQLGKHDFSCG